MKHEAIFIREEKNLFAFLENKFKAVYPSGARVLVKLHMGEPGNPYYLDPSLTKKIIDLLLSLDCRPFLFDTPVVYQGPRDEEEKYLHSAAQHGYDREHMGVPVVISNQSLGVRGEHLVYELAVPPLEADGVLLLSHFKGHLACGMGGAIKNVGMGCMSKETKGAIHQGGEPVYGKGCTQCKACVESCPTQNIRLDGGRPYFDCTWCAGCSNCIQACPENCLSPRVENFNLLLAEGAVLAQQRYRNVVALNVLKNITQWCDCMSDPGPVIVKDIGFVCADDMLTADIASLDILKEVTGKDDIFAAYNKMSPWHHVRRAAELMHRETRISIRHLP
ncbi:MAG: DUF362 domain-containing protein [Candidatus Krumholzibacteriota bacterium]|nr:DUF362 domain-containing protein [Candidatus Krumholzibacteriota bacterium]